MTRVHSYPQTQIGRDREEVRLGMLKMLLEFGIDKNAVNAVSECYPHEGSFYLQVINNLCAPRNSHLLFSVPLYPLLLLHSSLQDGSTVVVEAVAKNWLEDVRLLLDSGVSANTREGCHYRYRGAAAYRALRGDTLLILAARRNNLELVKLLLQYVAKENKIEVDLQGDGGMTAFMWAAFNNNCDVLRALMPLAAHNTRNEEGYSGAIIDY